MNSVLQYEMRAVGAVRYDPQRADSERGFGPYEVHPQRLPIVRDGAAQLEHNGDWLVLFPEGSPMASFAITATAGGRETAERLAAVRNDGLPTRVVGLDGDEVTSRHSADSVAAELLCAHGHA